VAAGVPAGEVVRDSVGNEIYTNPNAMGVVQRFSQMQQERTHVEDQLEDLNRRLLHLQLVREELR